MQSLRRGLLAGVLASLVLATLNFVTDGAPGNGLPSVLRWFGITIADATISHWAGFFLLIALGGVFGLIFGALQRDQPSLPVTRSLQGWRWVCSGGSSSSWC